MDVRHKLKWGVTFKVNNGRNTLFWEDTWILPIPLKMAFPTLYSYSRRKMKAVFRIHIEGVWSLDLGRPLDDEEFLEWSQLMEILDKVCLNPLNNLVSWTYEKSGQYTTKSMYRLLTFRGVVNKRMLHLWQSKLPLKLKIFMWLASQDRLQSGMALKQKNWKGDGRCSLCGVPENVDHIFFRCKMARFTWIAFKEALGWEKIPHNMQNFLENWLPLNS